jgi:hypothetical protein
MGPRWAGSGSEPWGPQPTPWPIAAPGGAGREGGALHRPYLFDRIRLAVRGHESPARAEHTGSRPPERPPATVTGSWEKGLRPGGGRTGRGAGESRSPIVHRPPDSSQALSTAWAVATRARHFGVLWGGCWGFMRIYFHRVGCLESPAPLLGCGWWKFSSYQQDEIQPHQFL